MEISFDKQANALYIKFQKGKFFRNKKIDKDTIIDLDKKGKILGIEFLNATKRIRERDLLDVVVNTPLLAR